MASVAASSIRAVETELQQLAKEHRKKEKTYRHLKALEAKRRAGEKLEKNQLEKLDSGLKKELEKELEANTQRRHFVLLNQSKEMREKLGCCGQCASTSHRTSDCPRRNAISPKSSAKKRDDKHTIKNLEGTKKKAPRHVPTNPKSSDGKNDRDCKKSDDSTKISKTRWEEMELRRHRIEREKSKPSIVENASALASSDASRQSMPKKDDPPPARILCVAEKPSIARALAASMSYGKERTRSPSDHMAPMCKLHDFYAIFPPVCRKRKCSITVTSVLGHICSTDFDSRDNTTVNPETLYSARTVKLVEDSSRSLYIPEHLIAAAGDCDYLYLWLDCDNEGENICFEIIQLLRNAGYFLDDSKIFRAHFSSLTEKALRTAFATPRRPRKALSDAVDARQELDLKIGVTFTRLLTWEFKDGAQLTFNLPKLKLISYGPCQTPTLNFCVARAKAREKFVPREFWTVDLVMSFGSVTLSMAWDQKDGRSFDRRFAQRALEACRQNLHCRVLDVRDRRQQVPPPSGLNTVQLLRAASLSMGISPKKCMEIAENLYTSGYITYPRTESTRYPHGTDVAAITDKLLSTHGSFEFCKALLENKSKGEFRVPKGGVDKGDHPPITPTLKILGSRGSSLSWRLYEFIVRNFFASLMPPFVFSERKIRVSFKSKDPKFLSVSHKIDALGWASVMPWRLKSMQLNLVDLSFIKAGMAGNVLSSALNSDWTVPPEFLKEYELIDAMDKHGIGTDASIPTHVDTIITRGYCRMCDSLGNPIVETGKHAPRAVGGSQTQAGRGEKHPQGGKRRNVDAPAGVGRFMVPTKIGIALIECFERVDRELCQPSIRATMEQELLSIADEKMSKDVVLERNLRHYFDRYRNFAASLDQIRPLFISEEAAFELIARTEKVMARGKNLATMSDFQIRRMEEEEYRLSGIIHQLEQIRMGKGRVNSFETIDETVIKKLPREKQGRGRGQKGKSDRLRRG